MLSIFVYMLNGRLDLGCLAEGIGITKGDWQKCPLQVSGQTNGVLLPPEFLEGDEETHSLRKKVSSEEPAMPGVPESSTGGALRSSSAEGSTVMSSFAFGNLNQSLV